MKKRIFGAILLCIIIIPLLVIGGIPFAMLMALCGFLSIYELLEAREGKKKFPTYLKVFAYIATVFLILNNYNTTTVVVSLPYSVLTLLALIFFFPILLVNNNDKYNLTDALFLFGTVLFIGLSFNLIMIIRNLSFLYIIYLFIITTMTDVFGLITGKLIGKTKLSNVFSPNKTVEGLIGGTIMSTILAMMFYFEAISPTADFINILIITITLSLIGQLGDLIFSSVKRFYNKKDFSNLIPGHGGILDRFDSIIFVSLAASLFLSII